LDLAQALGELGIWVRMHYVYPYPHVDDVIPLMAEGRILPYLDIPFQHASPNVLKAMRRPAHQEKTLDRIRKWRAICPELAVRSTFIVGFPGETEEDFEILLDWLSEARLERVGCFKYEPVATARANDLGLPAAPDETKQSRWNCFMAHQQKISADLLKRRLGKRIKVIVDTSNGVSGTGRVVWGAPECDGAAHLTAGRPVRVGEIVAARIERYDAYDLHGSVV